MHIYLAGPISGRMYREAIDWREHWAAKFAEVGFTTASPMRGKEHLKYINRPLAGTFDEGRPAVARDLWDIQRCDVLLANFMGASKPSIGTCCEIGYAHALGKFIVAVWPKDSHDHVFIDAMSSVTCAHMQDAFDWIHNMETIPMWRQLR